MEKAILSREHVSFTKCDLQDDGTWKVISEIKDRVLYDGAEDWVEESVSSMSIDSDVQRAIQTTMGSNLNYLTQTVYQNGFKGIVEYKEFERNLKEAKKSSQVADEKYVN